MIGDAIAHMALKNKKHLHTSGNSAGFGGQGAIEQ